MQNKMGMVHYFIYKTKIILSELGSHVEQEAT